MALSIADIGGVRGAANAARRALESNSRAWLAADLCLDTRELITEGEVQALGPDEAVRHRMDCDVDHAHHGGIGPVERSQPEPHRGRAGDLGGAGNFEPAEAG